MTSAKQVYEWVKTGHWSKRQFMEWVAATEESSAVQEPVAWMHKQGNHEEPSFRQLDDWEISNGWTQYPLYTHPQPKAEQEPVIGTKTWFEDGKVVTQYLHSSDIYKDPQPKREWVGLTDEEKEDCLFSKSGLVMDYEDVVNAVEAKLKEKNT